MVLEQIIENSTNRNHIPLSLIVRDNNQLAGVAELKYRENKNYPDYVHWIGGVFVDPNYRGRGISNLLIVEAQNMAVSMGIDKLYLQCESHNVCLYKKHGFRELLLASDNEPPVIIMLWEATT
jgi:putative hydrolase of the HAD superfamily